MMQAIKYILILFLFIYLNVNSLFAQEKSMMVEGYVSFISSQNVYVRFESTQNIKQGDTIFSYSNNQYLASLIVYDFSSISCICKPLNENALLINDKVYAYILMKATESTITIENKNVVDSFFQSYVSKPDKQIESTFNTKPAIVGRISTAVFSSVSNQNLNDYLRMRYTFFLKVDRIGNTNFSAESFVVFSHQRKEWKEIQENIYSGLKVYNIALKYETKGGTKAVIGRNINQQISNIGAIDGIQFQQKIRNFNLGVIAGFVPDHFDYHFNSKLIQYGGFLSHLKKKELKFSQTSIAFIEQKNNSMTDRRYLYFQHSNSLIKNLNTFVSCDLDLYKLENLKPTNTIDLSSVYLLMRYDHTKKLSFSASYDMRTNVILYETYKNYIDKLLQDDYRYGFSGGLRNRISNSTVWGINTSIRYRKGDASPMENVAFYIHWAKTRWKGAELNFTSNFINTNYLAGSLNGILLTKEIKAGKLNAGIQYRIFIGYYLKAEMLSLQHMPELQFNWKIYKKLTLSTNLDLFVEKGFVNSRLNLILTQRI